MRRVLLLALVAATLSSASVALAASLGVTSPTLTAFSTASTVPLSSCTLSPVADTDGASPTTSFGTSDVLRVRSSSAPVRTFLRFDLAACPVPPGADVRTATLSLSVLAGPTATRTYEARRVTGSWAESTLTWDAQPAVAASATSTASVRNAGVSVSWDVLADVQAFVGSTATDEGWRIADQDEGSIVAREASFGSRTAPDAAHRPVLSLTFYA